MDESTLKVVNYPLLASLLAQKGLELKVTYKVRDAAQMFDVSIRTIQDWIRDRRLPARNLPGQARFLSEDLESFLQNSARRPAGEDEK